jgi:hypothetical protein
MVQELLHPSLHPHRGGGELKPGKTIISEDECLSQALNFMRRVTDDCNTFGEYVAMELRSLSSDTYRRMLKREICESIGRTAELDDLNSLATCTTEFTEAPSPDPEPGWNHCLCQQEDKSIV